MQRSPTARYLLIGVSEPALDVKPAKDRHMHIDNRAEKIMKSGCGQKFSATLE